jgi:hypothetical protein
LAQSYSLTWHDIYTILSSTLSQRRDEGSGMQLRHMQMRFSTPTVPTPWEHWQFQRQNPIGTIKLMT